MPFFTRDHDHNYAGAKYDLHQNTFRQYCTWADHYLQAVILFPGHVLGSRPMKRKKTGIEWRQSLMFLMDDFFQTISALHCIRMLQLLPFFFVFSYKKASLILLQTRRWANLVWTLVQQPIKLTIFLCEPTAFIRLISSRKSLFCSGLGSSERFKRNYKTLI